jgi:glycosyltransferase involved in cell wall biosynthesis
VTPHPVFLSLVVVLRNQASELEPLLKGITETLRDLVSHYELTVVDNGSEDGSVAELERLTREDGLPNVQVYSLIKPVDRDAACWAGVENALGDFVAVFDPATDDAAFLAQMMHAAVHGADVVFAHNEIAPRRSFSYRLAFSLFNRLYQWLSGVHLSREAPAYRLLSRRVVNAILQHPQPSITYRHLPATGGFTRVNLTYRAQPRATQRRLLRDSLDRGAFLLVSTTRAPLRMVTTLCLFGAGANLAYSAYVIAVWAFKEDVAPGWVTLSLQQSGMFLLISVVLLVLGEYILHVASLSGEGPPYIIGREYTSARMMARDGLNVESAAGRDRGAH